MNISAVTSGITSQLGAGGVKDVASISMMKKALAADQQQMKALLEPAQPANSNGFMGHLGGNLDVHA